MDYYIILDRLSVYRRPAQDTTDIKLIYSNRINTSSVVSYAGTTLTPILLDILTVKIPGIA